MERYYIDACIWRDYLENRSDRFRPLGEWAFRLIRKIIKEGGRFVISDHLINELESNDISKDNILALIPSGLIIFVNETPILSHEAYLIHKRLKIPFPDALHAVLAKNDDAILVTRDKHFHELQDYVIIKKPEDLI